MHVEKWIETRVNSGTGGNVGTGPGSSKPNLTTIKLFRGYKVMDGKKEVCRVDREEHSSYKQALSVAARMAGLREPVEVKE